MKIISNSECFVQKSDIEYIIDNEKNIPFEVYKEFNRFEKDEYIKIDNPKSLEFILKSNIPEFSELYNCDLSKLEKLVLKLKLEVLDTDTLSEDEIKEIDEILREKRNREYILKQLKQIIDLKKHKSQINYPSVPNPNTEIISNGTLNASVSLNPDEVVIYNIDGSKVENHEDNEFIEVAYKLLMKDEIKDIDDINLTSSSYNNYLIVKKLEEKILKRKYKM